MNSILEKLDDLIFAMRYAEAQRPSLIIKSKVFRAWARRLEKIRDELKASKSGRYKR